MDCLKSSGEANARIGVSHEAGLYLRSGTRWICEERRNRECEGRVEGVQRVEEGQETLAGPSGSREYRNRVDFLSVEGLRSLCEVDQEQVGSL